MTTETTREAAPVTVTRDMLAEALTEFRLSVWGGSREHRGPVADPAEVADALHATLSRIAAERGDGSQLIPEPSAAAAELADLKRIHDREWRALWVITRQFGGSVFLTSAQLEEIPPLASLGTGLEPGGMRVNASEEP